METAEQLRLKLKRWHSRLRRAVNAIDKLNRQIKRLENRSKLAQLAAKLPVTAEPVKQEPEIKREPEQASAPAPKESAVTRPDDGIPHFLRRLQAMPDPKTKEKKAERKAIEKEKREAELTGKRRKLPLTGKAAMEAILGEAIYGKK